MGLMNRLGNAKNTFQGEAKRVLCVCSAGLLRSPTLAVVLAGEPWNYNTRAAGCVNDYALIPVDEVLLYWADMVVFAEPAHELIVRANFDLDVIDTQIVTLTIPDTFPYRDSRLFEAIYKELNEHPEFP